MFGSSTTGAGTGGFSFGSSQPAASSLTTKPTTQLNPLGTANTSFSLTTPAATTAAAASAPATTEATSTTSASLSNPTLTFKVLEDYINKWMNELDSQEKDFLNQATQLNALDKLMIENGDKVGFNKNKNYLNKFF